MKVHRGLFERPAEPEPALKARKEPTGPEILSGRNGAKWIRFPGSGRVAQIKEPTK